VNDIRFRATLFTILCTPFTVKLKGRPTVPNPPQPGSSAGDSSLWFSPPGGQENRRHALTREQVVAEALAVIAADGAGALSMRALAARLGVVPGALYRHVRSKEQLCDLAADAVLAEVDTQVGHAPGWAGQVKALAIRLRAALEDHPGIAALLKTRDPLGPHSLALAEAFLPQLQQAGLSARATAQAYSLIYDYTLGFALADRTTVNEQRARDPATRRQLHAFFRSLPADRFPALAAIGPHVWAGNRDQRFTAGLDTILAGLQARKARPASRPPRR
jgi:AcrR family transcriptional regulator